MVKCEKEIIEYLRIPCIPLNEWDGKASFKNGVALTKLHYGGYAYAVCTFNKDKDEDVRIMKTFANEPFESIVKVFIVPEYMNTNLKGADLDDESKKKAEQLVKEADELIGGDETKEDEIKKEMDSLPEWIFPEINNKEQAQAWLHSYNSKNKIKGRVPENEETIKMRLLNIYYSQQKKK